MAKDENKVEDPFGEEGVFDDKCEKCCRGCCCAPPPFRVALIPVILILAISIVVWALFWYDVTGLCAADIAKPPACVTGNVTDPITNVTRLVVCPADDHACAYLTVTNIPVAIWGIFMFVIVGGWAVIRAIVSIVWWIIRALSGKHGVMWEYLKPIDWAVHLIVWNFLFFICYNRFLFTATPLVYTVCRAVSVVALIVSLIYIFASLLATFFSRIMSAQARERAAHFRSKAKLVDKVINDKDVSMLNTFTLGMAGIAKKTAKNTAKTAKTAKGGEDVVIEMTNPAEKTIAEKDLKKAFERIDKAKKGKVNKEQMSEAAGVKGLFAKDLWKIFSLDSDAEIYLPEFVAGIREVERGLRDTLNELENRKFVAKIIRLLIMIILGVLGFTIAMQAIDLQIATLVTAISLLLVAVTMAMSGLFGRFLNCFVFLVFSHPYYKGDIAILGGEVTHVRKITLLNTYGFTPDNKWVMYDNAGIAGGRILNLSRSNDCVFSYETSVHAETPKKVLDTWERTLKAYVASKPEHWRDFTFNVVSVSGGNQLTVEMKAFVRGANWAHSELYNPMRAALWRVVHQSAIQLGVYAAPKDAETELVKIVDEEKDSGKVDDDSESSSEKEKKKAKKEKDLKKKESKKDK